MAIELGELIATAIDIRASDIHLKQGVPPMYRVDGVLRASEDQPLTDDDLGQYLQDICGGDGQARFEEKLELDRNFTLPGVSHCRVNICQERGSTRIVLRLIPIDVTTVEDLELPAVINTIADFNNGLAIVTGPTGSGKSTTLAAMIDKVNRTRPVHIVTIEDPIEYVHTDKQAIITQRQVGIDTHSFADALRGVLRQDPDVILIGEMRDAETMATALTAAETGHLVLSTLHTVDAVETMFRVMDFFPPHHQEQIRKQFGSVLRGIVSQRLVPRASGEGRVAAVEILVGNQTVTDFIVKGNPFSDIVKLMEEGHDRYGMQTFDQALYALWEQNIISEETALANASTARDLRLRMDGMRK